MNENSIHAQSKEINELHFLVTHWLSNYRIPDENNFAIDDILNVKSGQRNEQIHPYMKPNNDDERQRIVKRIRDISVELADAFHSLGAYGSAIEVSSDNLYLFD